MGKLQELEARLTPERVEHIVNAVGRHVASSEYGCGPERDLPFPKDLITSAFLKAMRDWPEDRFQSLCTTYVTLDAFMLSNEEYDVLSRWTGMLRELRRTLAVETDDEIAQIAEEAGIERAVEVLDALRSRKSQRSQSLDQIRKLKRGH